MEAISSCIILEPHVTSLFYPQGLLSGCRYIAGGIYSCMYDGLPSDAGASQQWFSEQTE